MQYHLNTVLVLILVWYYLHYVPSAVCLSTRTSANPGGAGPLPLRPPLRLPTQSEARRVAAAGSAAFAALADPCPHAGDGFCSELLAREQTSSARQVPASCADMTWTAASPGAARARACARASLAAVSASMHCVHRASPSGFAHCFFEKSPAGLDWPHERHGFSPLAPRQWQSEPIVRPPSITQPGAAVVARCPPASRLVRRRHRLS